MTDETIRSAPDQWSARQRNDPRRPINPERHDDPKPYGLQYDEETERQPVDGGVGGDDDDNGNQPCRVQRDEERIVPSAMLDRAPLFQASDIARGIAQLREALQRDQGDDYRRIHRSSRTRKPAVKPGPSALSNMRRLMRRRSTRSSTKKTVAADTLP